MKDNWIKMYDKFGCILRVETVINNPREFKVWRGGVREGQMIKGWFPMAKGVANLHHYARLSGATNLRYLNAPAAVENPMQVQQSLARLAKPLRRKGRSHKGLNPALSPDVRLFAAVVRGKHAIMGFRNADIRAQLFGELRDAKRRRHLSAQVSRILKRLHVHGLIAKIPRSRRWRVSVRGQSAMTMALKYHHEEYAKELVKIAA